MTIIIDKNNKTIFTRLINGEEISSKIDSDLKLNDLNYTKENEDKIFDEIKNIKNGHHLTMGYTKKWNVTITYRNN